MRVDKKMFQSFVDQSLKVKDEQRKLDDLQKISRVNFREYKCKALFIDGLAYFINKSEKLDFCSIDSFFYGSSFVKWNYGIKYYDDIQNFTAWKLDIKRKGGKVLTELDEESKEYIKQVVEQGYIN